MCVYIYIYIYTHTYELVDAAGLVGQPVSVHRRGVWPVCWLLGLLLFRHVVCSCHWLSLGL